MKKLVLVVDGLKMSKPAMEYAAYFSKSQDMHVVAAFMKEMAYKSEPVGQDLWWPYYPERKMHTVEELDRIDQEKQKEAASNLKQYFEKEGIPFTIHKDKAVAIQALLTESYFSDLIVMSYDTSFSNYDQQVPSHFMREALSEAGCPVIITPSRFSMVERFVFAYDGSPAAAYAIKQFTYLFSPAPYQDLEIVFASPGRGSSHLPGQQLLKELLKGKYKSVEQVVLRSADGGQDLAEHLETESRHCLLVMGAYSRSSLSRWLKHSMADDLIRNLEIPVFIAHH
jgi:hypothetical protein